MRRPILSCEPPDLSDAEIFRVSARLRHDKRLYRMPSRRVLRSDFFPGLPGGVVVQLDLGFFFFLFIDLRLQLGVVFDGGRGFGIGLI